MGLRDCLSTALKQSVCVFLILFGIPLLWWLALGLGADPVTQSVPAPYSLKTTGAALLAWGWTYISLPIDLVRDPLPPASSSSPGV